MKVKSAGYAYNRGSSYNTSCKKVRFRAANEEAAYTKLRDNSIPMGYPYISSLTCVSRKPCLYKTYEYRWYYAGGD